MGPESARQFVPLSGDSLVGPGWPTAHGSEEGRGAAAEGGSATLELLRCLEKRACYVPVFQRSQQRLRG